MRLLLLGAAGPVAQAAIQALEPFHHLRLADLQPIETPHESRVVDITDPDQVAGAAEGMDVLLNLTVNRRDPVAAFDVNTRGAHNVMQAAVKHGIRRVVHTGPFQHDAGYRTAFGITEDCPPNPGTGLYSVSKYLGQEICRAFALQHGIEVACLLFCNFSDPAAPDTYLHPFTISWEDSAQAIRRAVEVACLPSPFEVLHIQADLPHNRYRNDKAKRVLGWQPKDDFRGRWDRATR